MLIMAKNLVIVESPAKAHTIEKYLGSDFKVLASVGHIRKDTKVDKKTFEVTYEEDPEHAKIIAELAKAAKTCDKVWLATDEDREGESISWHLCEVLGLPGDTARITFHEITKSALEEAIKNPRKVDMDMVSSQQARQTLDMLVGYDLSDVVRRKVPGAVSAGRVQSPALRLIVEREKEIEKFESKFSFKISGEFDKLTANYDGKAPETEKSATELLEKLAKSEFKVEDVEEAEGVRANPVPFTTASLQIEANSKLGFSARTTMSAAQGLYQAGLITYHRTDSLNLSSQAVSAIAGYIKTKFGVNYLKTRVFKTKSAGAQEAHEAIRPTNVSVASAGKNQYEQKLYKLIWARTVATQMANAKVAKTTIKISHDFTAKGEVVIFDGFLKVYGNAKDTELPKLQKGDKLELKELVAKQTFAKPPARYTEGSLVKKLEELGIGRPSTYATIMSAIQARGYVVKGESEGEEREIIELVAKMPPLGPRPAGPFASDVPSSAIRVPRGERPRAAGARPRAAALRIPSSEAFSATVTRSTITERFGANKGKLLPTAVGELVAGFLTDNFKNIVDYKFTANIEKDLDLIAEAKLERVKMLKDFYKPFQDTVAVANGAERYNNARLLGHHPKDGKPIYAKIGKNGGFIQLGDNEKEAGEKPRFAPLPKRKSVKTVTLEQALKQLDLPALPRVLGTAPDGNELIAANGPFGPYLKGGKYNIPMKDLDPYTVTLEEALPVYQAKIDSIIADWDEIMIINGAYGPYIKGPGRRNHVKVPKEQDPKKITLEEAKKMLENKPKTTAKKARRGKRGAKKSTKKSAKKPAKKSAR